MKFPSMRWNAMALVLLIGLADAGCAKKAPAPAPTPPQPPVVTEPPPPPPPPAPPKEETPPTAPTVSSEDFKPAFFDFDSYALRDDARAVLDGNAKILRDHAEVNVTIEGHCDERGTTEYNQALGEKRAQAARDYLVGAGIASSRIQVISYGKERPFDPGHDESAWAKNRRAHFVVGS